MKPHHHEEEAGGYQQFYYVCDAAVREAQKILTFVGPLYQ